MTELFIGLIVGTAGDVTLQSAGEAASFGADSPSNRMTIVLGLLASFVYVTVKYS